MGRADRCAGRSGVDLGPGPGRRPRASTRPRWRTHPSCTGAGSLRPIDPEAGIENLDHLVFIVLENRSFDHYFGTFPGADGIPMDANGVPTVCAPDPERPGVCHRPYHDTNFIDQGGPARHRRLAHRHQRRQDGRVRDGGARDRQRLQKHPNEPPCPQATHGPQGQPDVMGYHTGTSSRSTGSTPRRYTLHDRMFAPTDSWTLPAHLFLISGVVGRLPGPEGPDELCLRAEVPGPEYGRQRAGSGCRGR